MDDMWLRGNVEIMQESCDYVFWELQGVEVVVPPARALCPARRERLLRQGRHEIVPGADAGEETGPGRGRKRLRIVDTPMGCLVVITR